MWSKPADPEKPSHIGYAIGFRIVESYYNNASDKTQAVNEILRVKNYEEFLQKSGYAQKFEE